MRYDPKESYEEWAKRVEMYEHGHAKMRIAEGENVDKVLEDMSKRITEKLLHPILKSIREDSSTVDIVALENSKIEYYEKMRNIGPKSDHVKDDNE
jgi:glutamyl-tRNA reductase